MRVDELKQRKEAFSSMLSDIINNAAQEFAKKNGVFPDLEIKKQDITDMGCKSEEYIYTVKTRISV